MRGIRGAITVKENSKKAIYDAAQRLMEEIIKKNEIYAEDIGVIIFSMTEDLTAAFPTAGIREIPGFDVVPLFDVRQLAIENSLKKCIRVLLLVDTNKSQRDIRHVYLDGAKILRPDLI